MGRARRGILVSVVFAVSSIVVFIQPLVGEAFQGLSSESTLLKPGKVDFRYRLRGEEEHDYNVIWWSPILKGGAGIVDFDETDNTYFDGAFLRPLQARREWGELLLGYSHVGTSTSDDYEFQGEYRFPSGLGFGGGFVERQAGGLDVAFGKATYRNAWKTWNYILEFQGQEEGTRTKPGGYVALYDEKLMLVYGNDGEQWRSTFGFIAPESSSLIRPTMEVLYVDSSAGDLAGTRFLFINATLGFQGGFLRHQARLGRAMGPTGLEFGNPLGFLRPSWNRRADLWELGALANFRLVRTRSISGVTTGMYEGLVFPFQFDDKKDMLDHIYAGGFYSASPGENSPGILGGVFGKFGFLKGGVGFDYNFDTREQGVVVGIIDAF